MAGGLMGGGGVAAVRWGDVVRHLVGGLVDHAPPGHWNTAPSLRLHPSCAQRCHQNQNRSMHTIFQICHKVRLPVAGQLS